MTVKAVYSGRWWPISLRLPKSKAAMLAANGRTCAALNPTPRTMPAAEASSAFTILVSWLR